jgi:hypothetical protein
VVNSMVVVELIGGWDCQLCILAALAAVGDDK